MQNTRTKASQARDRKLLNSLVKDPVWAIVVCTMLLAVSIISTAVMAIMYFTAEEPLPIFRFFMIFGIVDLSIFLIILLRLLCLRYKDALLKGEKILVVGDAPVIPVVICSIFIAAFLVLFVVPIILCFLPDDSFLKLLFPYPTFWLIRTALISLTVMITLIFIAVLLLRPKLFVTNKRIIGHGQRRWFRFKMYTSIPYASVTSVHVTCHHHLAIGTPSGDIHFYNVRNAAAIYRELIKMITAEQEPEAVDYDDYDDDYDYGYAMSYYAPAFYQHNPNMMPPAPNAAPKATAPAQQPATQRDFSDYKDGKPVVPKMPPKPRVPKF
ncbi:MAG: hypothetical protein IJW16_04145 [Clostridia bacterium]|nr:hypothetical protein [Clostridia bacterium]